MSLKLQNNTYKIDYSKKIYLNMIITGIINSYIGDKNNAFLLSFDTNNIYDEQNKKIEGYQDYKISIIPGDGKFLKLDRALKLNGFSHTRCNGCSTWINKKKGFINTDNIIPPDDYRFKICQDIEEYKLISLKLIGKVTGIDDNKKHIDVSISDYYELSNTC
jgi:hypothetical protein